ncbi:unnamed protein product [Rotaria sordida]|uniref:Uncharacterized protein n=1 Tax=Rotaria sordida TaxID=392033 RepID=A0A813X9M5_9BILA|nr:unnamed protein product [Rotaria sordida]CAF0866888.1 unnamed protein product [Rotaria sordida]
MKLLILIILIISTSNGYFTGCPMDGCESTLSGFVDVAVDGFDEDVKWRRTDLLTISSRGCVSNGLSSLICAVDVGYVSINMTNGQLLWIIPLKIRGKTETASLPIVNYKGFSIIANNTQCALIDPQGVARGIFNYEPILIPPLAGPFVTDDGQIIVADLVSFVGIEDTGLPLGVQSLPPNFFRLSRSMSLNRHDARWYLISQHNITYSRAIIATETTGSIVDRIRIAWIYEYGMLPNSCNGMEGPLLSMNQKWLFVVNTTGILIIADKGDSAIVITATRKAVLLLVDYSRHQLLGRFDLGYVSQIATFEPLTQLAYTETNDQQLFVTIAHKAVGLVTVQLLTSNQ